MFPHSANNLLLAGSVIYQFAFADYGTRSFSGLRVLVNDAMSENATVVGIHREVVAFFKALQALITPLSILSDNPILRHRPPAAFHADLTEQKADSSHLFPPLFTPNAQVTGHPNVAIEFSHRVSSGRPPPLPGGSMMTTPCISAPNLEL